MPKNSMISMEIKGGDDLGRALIALGSDKSVRAVLKRSLNNRATKAMVADARANAPKDTGRTAKKIDASTTLSRRQRRQRGATKDKSSNSAELFVGAGPRGPAILDEFGTTVRHHKSGKNVGSSPARPFMRPAWEKFKDAILKEFATQLGQEIEKAAKRIARKQAKLIRQGGK